MKTISLSEFKALIASDDWQRQQKLEVIDEFFKEDRPGMNITFTKTNHSVSSKIINRKKDV